VDGGKIGEAKKQRSKEAKKQRSKEAKNSRRGRRGHRTHREEEVKREKEGFLASRTSLGMTAIETREETGEVIA
jgi:hypothetical protein